jgi:hypothetical protein
MPYSNSHPEIFIAKFDKNGTCLWAKAPWDTAIGGFETTESIGIDQWGEVYVTGDCQGNVYFGCDTIKENSFFVKLDSSGNRIWDKAIKNATATALRVGQKGSSFITGTYTSNSYLGVCNISTSGSGIFITKLDSMGNCVWTQLADGNSKSYGIDCDYSHNCYIIGGIYSNTEFGSITLTNSASLPPSILVAKLDVSTGIIEISNSPNTFNIYPNPSAGGYTLQISASLLNSQLTIYDTQGRNVFQTKIVQENPVINIPSLAKGMYYVKLITPQQQSTEKTIVQQ